jgi:hypothetical protein
MEQHVLLNITQCATTITYFSLYMFRIRFDTSTLVINFINDDFAFKLQLLFEPHNTSKITLVEWNKIFVGWTFIHPQYLNWGKLHVNVAFQYISTNDVLKTFSFFNHHYLFLPLSK